MYLCKPFLYIYIYKKTHQASTKKRKNLDEQNQAEYDWNTYNYSLVLCFITTRLMPISYLIFYTFFTFSKAFIIFFCNIILLMLNLYFG